MAVFTSEFQARENLAKIVTLGDYLPTKRILEAHGALKVAREGGETGYSTHEIKDLTAAKRLTRQIDALNLGRKWAREHFSQQLAPMLADGVAVAIVPSHDPFHTETPLRTLAQSLPGIDATRCLVRHTKIRRIVFGGPSYVHLHRETISVVDAEIVVGRSVLLLDDVAKSGQSLKACRELLLEAGAHEVQMLALGRVAR